MIVNDTGSADVVTKNLRVSSEFADTSETYRTQLCGAHRSQCEPGGRLTVAVAPELVNVSADLGSIAPSTSTMGPMPRPPLGQVSCIVTELALRCR